MKRVGGRAPLTDAAWIRIGLLVLALLVVAGAWLVPDVPGVP